MLKNHTKIHKHNNIDSKLYSPKPGNSEKLVNIPQNSKLSQHDNVKPDNIIRQVGKKSTKMGK